MTQDDLQHLSALLRIHEQRRKHLQLQLARQGHTADPSIIMECEELDAQVMKLQDAISDDQSKLYTLQPDKSLRSRYWVSANLTVLSGNAEFKYNSASDNIAILRKDVLREVNRFDQGKSSFINLHEIAHFMLHERASAFYANELLSERDHALKIETNNLAEIKNAVKIFVRSVIVKSNNNKRAFGNSTPS